MWINGDQNYFSADFFRNYADSRLFVPPNGGGYARLCTGPVSYTHLHTVHMHEGMFRWHDLPMDCLSFGARYTRARYRHPFFVLENKAKGTTFIGQLAYSGGYRFSFDVNPERLGNSMIQDHCSLAFSAKIEARNPLRVIAPRETIKTPELIIGMVNGDLDKAVNGMHSFIRNSVMHPQARSRGCWVETAGHGNIEEDKICVDRAAEMGYDIFYIDANWYFPIDSTRALSSLSLIHI